MLLQIQTFQMNKQIKKGRQKKTEEGMESEQLFLIDFGSVNKLQHKTITLNLKKDHAFESQDKKLNMEFLKGQAIFKEIQFKKKKVNQFKLLKANENNSYIKIAGKLKRDLREMKSHESNLAKQKLSLLQTCLKHKHNRCRNLSKAELPHYRTCRSSTAALDELDEAQVKIRGDKNNIRPFSTKVSVYKGNRPSRNKENTPPLGINFMHKKKRVDIKSEMNEKMKKIHKKCNGEKENSKTLEGYFQTMQFYHQMVFRNSNRILKKIL